MHKQRVTHRWNHVLLLRAGAQPTARALLLPAHGWAPGCGCRLAAPRAGASARFITRHIDARRAVSTSTGTTVACGVWRSSHLEEAGVHAARLERWVVHRRLEEVQVGAQANHLHPPHATGGRARRVSTLPHARALASASATPAGAPRSPPRRGSCDAGPPRGPCLHTSTTTSRMTSAHVQRGCSHTAGRSCGHAP